MTTVDIPKALKEDFEKKIDSLCEELGEPVSALGPQMLAARDAERAT